jgi:hypothetical protein
LVRLLSGGWVIFGVDVVQVDTYSTVRPFMLPKRAICAGAMKKPPAVIGVTAATSKVFPVPKSESRIGTQDHVEAAYSRALTAGAVSRIAPMTR